MEMALRRRLAGVAEVSISQQEQTAAVRFVPGTQAFSAAAFRGAVAEADVEVLTLDLHVCGVVDGARGLRVRATDHAPVLLLRGNVPPSGSVCVTGRLDDGAEPDELEVVSAQPRR